MLHNPSKGFLAGLLAAVLLVISCTSCLNLFEAVDDPSGDPQILSAARACFDQGDLECALDYYKRLSADYKDIRNSEEAFAILDRAGIQMSTFMEAFGNGGSIGLGKLANLLSGGATAGRRDLVFEAFKKYQYIDDPSLRDFVRFVTALTLAAHFLAEDSNANGTAGFSSADFVQSPTTCAALELTACSNAACDELAASQLSDAVVPSGSDTSLTASSDISGSAQLTLQNFHKALLTVLDAMNGIGAGGKFGTGLGAFVTKVQQLSGIGNARCYRYLILKEGIGS